MPQFTMSPNLSHNIRANCGIFNAVYAGYIEAIYFTDTEFDSEDRPDGDAEMAFSAQFAAMSECADFLAQCADAELLGEYATSGQTWEQMGHDLWLTRNGHGVGFWDRGTGELGEALTKIAKRMGGRDTYQGDDGLIYFG